MRRLLVLQLGIDVQGNHLLREKGYWKLYLYIYMCMHLFVSDLTQATRTKKSSATGMMVSFFVLWAA